jgi:copper chaperone CopZ
MIVERVLAVQGMTCEGCERAIRGALGRLDGIVEASPDHRTGRVSVRYDAERVSGEAIKQRTRLAGYDTE